MEHAEIHLSHVEITNMCTGEKREFISPISFVCGISEDGKGTMSSLFLPMGAAFIDVFQAYLDFSNVLKHTFKNVIVKMVSEDDENDNEEDENND